MTELTISEARAEAATVVLRLMLERLDPDAFKRLYKAARKAAKDIGHRRVRKEIDWLFLR